MNPAAGSAVAIMDQLGIFMRQIKDGERGIGPRQHAHGAEADSHSLSGEYQLLAAARGILERRRQREAEFNSVLFGEPAWEMLLELFVLETAGGSSSTLTQLTARSRSPASAVVRWVKFLERDGLVVLRRHPTDHGTEFVELTSEARQSLEKYLASAAASVARTSGDLI